MEDKAGQLDVRTPTGRHGVSDDFSLLVEVAACRGDVLGVVLGGSRGKGLGTVRSDWDVYVVIDDQADTARVDEALRPAQSSMLDLVGVTRLGAFREHALYGCPDHWNADNFAHLAPVLDRLDGGLTRLCDEKEEGCLTTDESGRDLVVQAILALPAARPAGCALVARGSWKSSPSRLPLGCRRWLQPGTGQLGHTPAPTAVAHTSRGDGDEPAREERCVRGRGRDDAHRPGHAAEPPTQHRREVEVPGEAAWSEKPRDVPLTAFPVRLPRDQYSLLRTWFAENSFSMATAVRGLVERFLADQGSRTA